MFGIWVSTFKKVKQHIPKAMSTFIPNADFITLHYAYIIGWTLIGSIMMYGNGRIPYIDAIFFASGAATQSGLNTIDVNVLALYQQVVIMLVACVCNPIFINTSVVFVRLYWFEKRFQDVVLRSRMRGRRTQRLEKGEGETIADIERDVVTHLQGVGTREIRVIRCPSGHAHGGFIENEIAFNDGQDRTGNGIRAQGRSSIEEPDQPLCKRPAALHRTAADTGRDCSLRTPGRQQEEGRHFTSVKPPVGLLSQASNKRRIAPTETQQHPTVRSALRIPGPRDFDRGHVPEEAENSNRNLHRFPSRVSHESNRSRKPPNSVIPDETDGEIHPFKHHITIDVSDRPRLTAGVSLHHRFRTTQSETSISTSANNFRSRLRSGTFTSFLASRKEEFDEPMPYLSWTPTIGRNSNFVDLTEEQREELGGIEYHALKLLSVILVSFFVGFHLLGMVCLLPWINRSAHYGAMVKDVGISPTWWGFFTPASMFNDLGFTLTPDSMISFQEAVFPLILGTFLIIVGNTGFPCMLRFVIWGISMCVPKTSGVWEELCFLLDHPRRCFTLLFPSKANWWLFWILVLLNGVDLMFFIVLDLKEPTVSSLPYGIRFLAGLFQAASTSTAGFAVVNLPELHPAIQVSYMIMMYISVFPIAMSIRQSNVYEERSLGVWASGEREEDTQSSYLSHHLRRQLSFDLWFVFLGFFLIAIIEGSRLDNINEYAFSLFSVLFEIVSAYGTVGLSQGYPGSNTSFSGQFRTLSKLIIIAMQIRGRHRGLPYGLDRAIQLPSESLHQKENEDATLRARCVSNATGIGVDGLTRAGTSFSHRSVGPSNRTKRSSMFQPQQIKESLAGAFRARPTAPLPQKMV